MKMVMNKLDSLDRGSSVGVERKKRTKIFKRGGRVRLL
jgi:hypothetical protein